MKKPVVVVDLFCGMGGFTQGAIDAGAEVILSIDSWGEACSVHEENHPDTRIDCISLGNPDWYKGLLSFLKPYRGLCHIHLHGSPPCQALSNASSRDPSEGMPMVTWFLNLVKSVMPDSWSMENVVPMRKRLPEGTPTAILNSADFGVPQTRRRCYAGSGWIAEPTHTKEEWVSVIEALPHLVEEFGEIGLMDSGRGSAPSTGRTKDGKKGGGSGPLFRDLDEPSYTTMSWPRKICVNTAGCGDSVSKGATTRDSTLDKPSKTLHNNTPTLRTTQPKRIRSLTLEETLVLQGFPSDYDLSSSRTMKSRWTMVGNAVPPPVAEAVIRGIQNGN
jgi:DNA (cytosine-5)-methyltransferase 1